MQQSQPRGSFAQLTQAKEEASLDKLPTKIFTLTLVTSGESGVDTG